MRTLGTMLAVSWVLSYLTEWTLETAGAPWFVVTITMIVQSFLVWQYFATLRTKSASVKFTGTLHCAQCGTELRTRQDLIGHACSDA